jgi:5-methylcytosine-specific restriction endonuclease McrA
MHRNRKSKSFQPRLPLKVARAVLAPPPPDPALLPIRFADVRGLNQQVLRTDVAGMPLEWVDYREAVRLYHMRQVAYSCGTLLYRLRGGYNARSGRRTVVEVNSIIATVGHSHNPGTSRSDYVPPLNNETLFKRDAYLCLYCGGRFPTQQLSRDHVRPFCRGGDDRWTNVVTACRRCNNAKASRTPEEAEMQLLAVPFTPTYAEYIYLKGRRVLADQMEYLLAHFPRSSPLHERIRQWLQ